MRCQRLDIFLGSHTCILSQVKLLRGIDVSKDQSFFLSRVNQEALKCSMFPLGRYFSCLVFAVICSFQPVVDVVLFSVYVAFTRLSFNLAFFFLLIFPF